MIAAGSHSRLVELSVEAAVLLEAAVAVCGLRGEQLPAGFRWTCRPLLTASEAVRRAPMP